jgi:ectoine hydroxylase-related dioxygenase (phytanoyl-CoA dioxygenase family)
MTIPAEQRMSFANNGFMILEGFLTTGEIDLVRDACDKEIERVASQMRSEGVPEDGINVLDRKYFINNARLVRPALLQILFSEKVADVCRATIGDAAYLHNEQFVVKMMDKATTFAWHQDSGYSVYKGGAQPHDPYVTCWVALDDMSEKNGTISVLPFPRYEPSREILEHVWSDEVNALVGYQGDDEGDLVEVPAGTLVAFSSRLLHKSGANTTDRPRRSYFMAYTPTLFKHQDESKGVYSQGVPVLIDGEPKWREARSPVGFP